MCLAGGPAGAAPARFSPPAAPSPEQSSLLLDVRINGKATGDLAMLRTLSSECDQMEMTALRAAGLYEGAPEEACLQAVAGIDYRLDREAARIEIFSERLAPEAAGRRVERRAYARELSGVIGEYGLSVQHVDDGRRRVRSAFGDLTLTAHTRWGRVQNNQVAAWDGNTTRLQRLSTTYERDFPDSSARLTLGDSFSRAPRWGRVAAFAGVQYGTDFSMDTDQSWRPYRTFQTLLREQSEIDVRVNGVLRQRESLASGFSDVLIIPEAGLNDVEIAIRDGTGLTRIEDVSFFSATDDLAEGVTDFSVSAGTPRRFNGLRSEYGDRMIASGLVRRGLGRSVTAELHGEVSDGAALVGGGAQFAAGDLGIVNLSAGISGTGEGARGHLVAAGLARNTRRTSLQLQARVADTEYADLAAASGAQFPDVSLRASAGVFTQAGSFRTSYSEQTDRVLTDRRFLTFGWEKSLGGSLATLAASGYHDLERDESGCTVSLRMNFGAYSLRTSADRAGRMDSAAIEVSRLRQADERMQWSVRAIDAETGGAAQANLQADLGMAELFAHAGEFGGTTEMSAGVRGGFTVMPSHVSLAQQTTAATAVVRVAGLAGVPVYQDNRRVAVTDADGTAIVPGVRPYEVNRLSLQPEDVPLDYSVAAFDIDFVPRRGIAEVAFVISREIALAFTVILPDGEALAAGSRVELAGSGQTCPVGMEGRVYCASAEDVETVIITTPVGTFQQSVLSLRRTGRLQLGADSALRYAGVS